VRIGTTLCCIEKEEFFKVMLDQLVMLLDFFPIVKLKRGVLNYITKQRKNGLSPND
jgi:hypothetical protein